MKGQRKKRIIGAAVVCGLVAFTLLSWGLIGKPLVRFISDPDAVRAWVDKYGLFSRLAFIGMVMLQVILAVIPGEPFEIAAGYAFGALEGTLFCVAGDVLGSLAVFFLVRKFGFKLVRIFFSEEQMASVHFLKTTQKREILLAILFVLPGTPKDLIAYFAGLTDVRFPVWFLICSVARIPSVITSTIGGAALGTRNYTTAAVAFAVAVCIGGLGYLLYRRISKRHKRGQEKKNKTDRE